jgi:hypothetical protein
MVMMTEGGEVCGAEFLLLASFLHFAYNSTLRAREIYSEISCTDFLQHWKAKILAFFESRHPGLSENTRVAV